MSGSDIDYGPLAALIGTWQGDKGMDVSPEPDGIEENPYYETIVFEAAGDVTNAEAQTLAWDEHKARERAHKAERSGRPPSALAGVPSRLPALLRAAKLQRRGYTNVHNLEGSIFEWANSGRALSRADGPATAVHPYDAEWGRLLERELWSPLDGSDGAARVTFWMWLAVVSAAFALLERVRPARRAQRVLRPQLANDLFYLAFNGHLWAILTGGVAAWLASS